MTVLLSTRNDMEPLQALLAPPLTPGRAGADSQRALRFLNPEVVVRRVAA